MAPHTRVLVETLIRIAAGVEAALRKWLDAEFKSVE